MNESRKRSFTKAVTYRFLATSALAVISWLYTGDLGQTTTITVVFTIVAIMLYYVHERIWDSVK